MRSRKALALTDFFKPEEYDGVFEITDAEAYGLNKRVIQEDSIICGPTCAMALAAALKAVPDEPGNLVVVMFPDNAFKYMTSYAKHLPELFPQAASSATSIPFAEQLQAAVAFAENGPDILAAHQAHTQFSEGSILLDVRNPPEVQKLRVKGALSIPLDVLTQGASDALPSDTSTPIITLCAKGKRSIYALLLLKAQGYTNVKSVWGGIAAWDDDGLPTEHD